MSEPALKFENNSIFRKTYSLKLFIAFKMAYCYSFGLRGNLDFRDFLKKSFVTSTTGGLSLFCSFDIPRFSILEVTTLLTQPHPLPCKQKD